MQTDTPPSVPPAPNASVVTSQPSNMTPVRVWHQRFAELEYFLKVLCSRLGICCAFNCFLNNYCCSYIVDMGSCFTQRGVVMQPPGAPFSNNAGMPPMGMHMMNNQYPNPVRSQDETNRMIKETARE